MVQVDNQKNEAKFKVGDKVAVTDRDMMTWNGVGTIHSIKGNEYFVKFKDDLVGTTLIPHTADQLKLMKESKTTKQLIEAANRKCEMRWKVLVFNPDEDNKLVKEFKDFDCIDCAAAKKREYLEKNPTHIVEIISEAMIKPDKHTVIVKHDGKIDKYEYDTKSLADKYAAEYKAKGYDAKVVKESTQKNESKLKYFTYTQNGLKTKADCDKALSYMKKELTEEPNFDVKKVIQRDMEIVKSWKSQKNETSSLQALNKELANNVENLYVMAKHVRDRFKYRTLQNMSYDEAQAEKIYDQIEDVIEDAVKKLAAINSKVIG